MAMNISKNKVKVGSRASRLAVLQVDEFVALLRGQQINLDMERVTFATAGDTDKQTSLTETVRDDFFTDTLDAALLNGDIDLTVHSAKDLPKSMRAGLSIFCMTAAVDETDCFVGRARLDELPPNAKIGTSSDIRQQSLKLLKPDAVPVNIRGTIEERIQLIDRGVCDGIIVATAALKRLGLEQHIKDILPWEAAPLQGQLAVVGRTEDIALRSLLAPLDVRRQYGRVILVGAGPGDPGLITVKGVAALRQAGCIFYDYLTSRELLKHASPGAQLVDAGKRKGGHTLKQEELSRRIRLKAMEGKDVVRLKGGDPLIFGRGADEIEYLRSYHIDVSVIPGISSATGIPSSLGVPLTARELSSSVAFISGHGKGESVSEPQPVVIPKVDTVVFLMGLTKLDIILESLTKAGWSGETPVLIVSKGTCPDEKVVEGNIKTIAQKARSEQLAQPALIIAGKTVSFWGRPRYPKGRILYTGTNPQAYKRFGEIAHLPMIQLDPATLSPDAVDGLIERLDGYDMVLLTSRAAVNYFFRMLEKRGYDLNKLRGKDFAVIGKSTAQVIRQYRIEPAFISPVETSVGMLAAMTERYELKGKTILFPRSSLPNPYLSDGLTARGAEVDLLTVYENTPLPRRPLPMEGIEQVIFTSPSTVRNFLKDYGVIPRYWKILSRGSYTSQSLKEAGYESEVLTYD